jgi:hypothetical protein
LQGWSKESNPGNFLWQFHFSFPPHPKHIFTPPPLPKHHTQPRKSKDIYDTLCLTSFCAVFSWVSLDCLSKALKYSGTSGQSFHSLWSPFPASIPACILCLSDGGKEKWNCHKKLPGFDSF